MRALLIPVLLASASLPAQGTSEVQARENLTSALMALQVPGQELRQKTAAVSAALAAVPEPMHQPKPTTLASLAHGLATNLAGRNLQRPAAAQLAAVITGALRSAGMGTWKFKELVSRFEEKLVAAGVDAPAARALAGRLRTAGEEVRGPEDIPARQD